MTGLAALVRGLAARNGVQTVLLVSGEGLPVEHAAESPAEAETIAALTTTLGRHASWIGGRPGKASSVWPCWSTRVACWSSPARTAETGSLCWPTPNADIGALLYDLRHHRAALAKLL